MPKWIPGKQNGHDVRVQFNLPIKFTQRKVLTAGEQKKRNEANIHYNKGVEFAKNNDYENGLKEFKEVVKIAPKDVEAAYNIGYMYFKLNKTQEACDVWMELKKNGNSIADKMLDKVCIPLFEESPKKYDIFFLCKLADEDKDGLKVLLFEVNNNERKLVNTILNTQKFKESFEYQKVYVIRFEKEGHITKELQITTQNISILRWNQDFAKLSFNIQLNKQTGDNSTILSAGKIVYSDSTGDFDFQEE